MNFGLSPEHTALQMKARIVAQKHIAPVAAHNDREEIFPRAILDKLAPTGLMTPTLPLELGGSGADFIGEALVFEEIGKVCSSVRTILSVHNSLCTLAIKQWSSEEQQARYLPELGHGRHLGCFVLTEFTAGSEATNQNLQARLKGNEWVLNGR